MIERPLTPAFQVEPCLTFIFHQAKPASPNNVYEHAMFYNITAEKVAKAPTILYILPQPSSVVEQ